jgi:hypothetical protein
LSDIPGTVPEEKQTGKAINVPIGLYSDQGNDQEISLRGRNLSDMREAILTKKARRDRTTMQYSDCFFSRIRIKRCWS